MRYSTLALALVLAAACGHRDQPPEHQPDGMVPATDTTIAPAPLPVDTTRYIDKRVDTLPTATPKSLHAPKRSTARSVPSHPVPSAKVDTVHVVDTLRLADTAALNACEQRNAQLYSFANDVLDRYKKYINSRQP